MAPELNLWTSLYFCGGIFLCYLTKKYFSGTYCPSENRIDGKTVIITGANTGIGKATAEELARRGGRVILACRNLNKGTVSAEEVINRSGNKNVVVKRLDLASLASVRRFAEEILNEEAKLDILVNNAGVMLCPHWTTEDGFEMQFGVNYLGHFLLTNLLLDLLQRSATSRIVNVSSICHRLSFGINFDDINCKQTYNRLNQYARSKLANLLFTRELARRLVGTQVTTFSLHPGVVNTELARHSYDYFGVLKLLWTPIYFLFCKTPLQGAQTSIYLAVANDIEKYSGSYFSDCALASETKIAQDAGLAKKLWDVSLNMVGL